MERIVTAFVEQSLARGGLLLHAALVVRDGVGFVLAGPSGVGKSTASRRVPEPWRSLSDDCVLVVRARDGRYLAHPWPTWSLLRKRGTVATWPVEQAVPLKALLFLTQSLFDRAEPVATTLATALVAESALHLVDTVTLTPDGHANQRACRRHLRAAWALAASVPGFRLQVSLTGQFWNEIEKASLMKPRMGTDRRRSRHLVEMNPQIRNRSAEMPRYGAAGEGRKTAKSRRSRAVPGPPRRLLSGSPRPRLVRFRTRDRTFLKVMQGRRVIASANDLLREWHTQRRSRRKR